MLCKNEKDRFSAEEILDHPWLLEESICSYEEASNYVRDIISGRNWLKTIICLSLLYFILMKSDPILF